MYVVARQDRKRGPVEDSKSRTSGSTDLKEKVGLDWPHPQKACQQHHQAGSDLEPTGEEKGGGGGGRGGGEPGTHSADTLRQKYREAVSP